MKLGFTLKKVTPQNPIQSFWMELAAWFMESDMGTDVHVLSLSETALQCDILDSQLVTLRVCSTLWWTAPGFMLWTLWTSCTCLYITFSAHQLLSDDTYSSYLNQNAETTYPKVCEMSQQRVHCISIPLRFILHTIQLFKWCYDKITTISLPSFWSCHVILSLCYHNQVFLLITILSYKVRNRGW